MERRPNLVRRAGLTALALLLVGGLSACGGEGPVGKPPAATVDGRDISAQRVLDLAKAYAELNRTDLADALKAGAPQDSQSLISLREQVEAARGDGAGTYGTDLAASSLQQLMVYEAVIAELDRNDLEVTAAEEESARKDLESNITTSYTSADGGGLSEKAAKKKLEAVPEELLAVTAATQAAQTELATLMTKTLTKAEQEARIKELFAESVKASPYCISAAYALDEQGAQASKDRIDDGADFDDVAAQTISPTTGGPGGPFGCGSAEQLTSFLGEDVTSFDVGDVIGPIGPVQLSQDGSVTGYLVVQLTSVTGDTLDRARPQLEQQLQAELTPPDPNTDEGRQAIQARGLELLGKADVTVDARYGTFDRKARAVVPPVVPGAVATTEVPETVPGAADPSAAGS